MTLAAESHPEPVDEDDGLPVWPFEPGTEIVPGAVAIEHLGTGHRCETWLAWSVAGWHPVVVKLARPHQVDHPRAAQTLHREVAASVGHPGLARVFVDASDEQPPYVVMEYLDGPTVADLIEEHGALDPHDVVIIGIEILSALRSLHRAGLAHVDLKSENVVMRDGRPFVIDGGSARVIGRSQPKGRPVGTEGYVAPEMEACRPISAAMDLFGLGTVLAEALTGVPFPEIESLPDVAVSAVVRRLLDPDPEVRGTDEVVMVALATLCGDDRPWPEWADEQLLRS